MPNLLMNESGFRIHLRRAKLSEATRRKYINHIRYLESKVDFNSDSVRDFLDSELENGKSEALYNKYVSSLVHYLDFLGQQRWSWLSRIKEKPKAPIAPTADEIKKIIKCDTNTQWCVYFCVLAYTGLRPGECAKLRKEEIDTKNLTIQLNETKTESRLITFHKAALEPILKHIEGLDGQYLFKSRIGKRQVDIPVSVAAVENELRRRLKLCQITRKITPHKFRHTFITDLLDEDANLAAVKHQVGHKSISTTENYYRYTVGGMKRAVNKLSFGMDKISPDEKVNSGRKIIESMFMNDSRFDKYTVQQAISLLYKAIKH